MSHRSPTSDGSLMSGGSPMRLLVTARVARSAVAAVVAVGLVVVAGCSAFSSPGATVVIGVDLPLTGASSRMGEVYAQALELRVEQINERQLAGEGVQVQLRVLDNHGEQTTAADNLQQLAADP